MSAVSTQTVPELKKEGYDHGFIASMIAGSGALAPIIPPSTNMIVYASLTGFSVGKLFMGGLMPGIIIGICLMIMCYWYAKKYDVDRGSGAFSLRRVAKAFIKSFFALITPVIILAGVVTGFFTATESSIVACIYALICGFFIYRTLKIGDLMGIFKRAASSSAMLMMIMGISNIYSYIFARENVTPVVEQFLLSITDNPSVLVFIIIVMMLIIGCFMDLSDSHAHGRRPAALRSPVLDIDGRRRSDASCRAVSVPVDEHSAGVVQTSYKLHGAGRAHNPGGNAAYVVLPADRHLCS